MSGPLSVPLAIGAFFVPGYIAKVGLASTAIVCAAFSSYWVWRRERETAIELEERLQRDDRALKKQGAVDGLSEELSWAIQHLLNRNKGKAWTEEMIAPFEADMSEWCEKISKKLENREFFSRSEQLHFDSLGFVKPVQITCISRHSI